MAFPLKDGVAVLTGAASGIGRALALALAARGCALALIDRDGAALATTAETAGMSGVPVSEHVLDITDAAAIAALPEQILARHGRVSLLVNNAGVALMGTFPRIAPDDFTWLMEINFWGTVRMTRAFLPALLSEPRAQIVTLSSIFGLIAPAGQTAYAAAKFAVRGFSEALRHELEGTGIGVSVVHPGGVRTEIAARARIAPGIDQATATRATERFSRILVTTPEQAASRILRGIERREKRILVGRDAVALDILQRLRPVGYWASLRKRLSGGDLPGVTRITRETING